eukprot:XP_025002737.1 FH2 domain-containing protein 1-like isoform X2 [Gallus gallus]
MGAADPPGAEPRRGGAVRGRKRSGAAALTPPPPVPAMDSLRGPAPPPPPPPRRCPPPSSRAGRAVAGAALGTAVRGAGAGPPLGVGAANPPAGPGPPPSSAAVPGAPRRVPGAAPAARGERRTDRRVSVAAPRALTAPHPQAALLEPKRSIALGVLLKQLKRPVRQIVRDIEEGVGAPYGAELLLELSRLLPGAVEVSRLRAFSGCPQQLPEPELFMLLLLELRAAPGADGAAGGVLPATQRAPRLHPNPRRRRGGCVSGCGWGGGSRPHRAHRPPPAEVVRCEELHAVLHLVLSAGNHLNAGGYAGSAAGFRLASLRRLPDTRANVPGVDLLHFVAMEAARTDRRLLDFPSKLPHVGPASRIEEAEVEAELRRLSARVAEARGAGAALCAALRPFVRAAEAELRAVRAERERMCGAAAAALDFYCEEAAPGALRELCAVLHGFAGRFLSAVQVTQPGPPSRRLSPPRSALTPSPRRRTAPGSSPSAGGSSSSCSGTSGAPSPRVRCGTRSPTDPADPSATLRRCSGGIRPRRSPSCGATPDPRGPRRSPPLRLPPPPRPPPASPRCSLDGGPAALPPRRRAAPRCSAFCGAWRAGRRAEPPRAESRRVLSSPVLLCDDNKCFGPPPGCGTYSAGSEVRDAV